MKLRKSIAVLGTGVLLAAAAACGGSSSGSSSDGVLNVAYHLAPGSLDPIEVPIWQLTTYTEPMYDAVTYVDPDGNVQPMLATEWSFTDDTLDLTFREDVAFHDGTPFNADAFKVNIDRLLAADSSPVATMFAAVDGVEVTGEFTASMKLNEIDSSIPAALGDRGGLMVSPKAIADGVDLTSEDAGSGPYELVEYKPGEKAVYEKFDGYWDAAAQGVDKIEIEAIGDGQARLNGATSKKYDITYLTPSQFEAAKGAGLDVEQKTGLWFINIFTNRQRSELGNLKARQAIAHAIDREAICQAVYFDRCKPTSSIFPTEFWAGSDDVPADYYEFDQQKAKDLLKEAGLPNGFEFEMLFAAGADPYPQFAELMQSQLKEVGITMKLKPVDINQLSPLYFFDKKADAMLGGGGQVADPGQSLQKEFASGSTLNASGDAPGGLDDVIKRLAETTDQAAREETAQEATKIAADQVLNVPLVQPEVLFALNPDTIDGYDASYVGAYAPTRGVTLK
ncbi:ABC transporter substrate-binding protein [Nocardioides alcanivorans]|uniref:ABC transporter substrate-binding protein n=1 Tax=Nocardioides alcanivorans TaxID=2897352 RepID=UPI001F2325BB|nr:ABC transporter substrate-binding protein [Nocardioides alcanivorans]